MLRRIDFQTISDEYIKRAVAWNQKLLLGVSIFSMLVELFNIVRVLIFSNSGLGTVNNRIYFGLYLSLFAICFFYVIAVWSLRRNKPAAVHYWICMAGASLMLLWQTVFQIYDMQSGASNGYITIVAALVAFSAVVIMRPVYAALNLFLNYGLFFLALHSFGDRFNFSIMLALCFVIYAVKYQNTLVGILQEQELKTVHRELSDKADKLRLSNEQYEILAHSSNLIAFQWNIEGDWVHFASNWQMEFDWPVRIENFWDQIQQNESLPGETRHTLYRCVQRAQMGIVHQNYEVLLPAKDGLEKWYEVQITVQKDKEGKPFQGIGFLSNIMKQKEKIAELEVEIQMDAFTRLLNKKAIEQRGKELLKNLKSGEQFHMMLADIDDFKYVNDHYGHICGDHVLKTIANAMSNFALPGMEIGRLGGDELVAFLVGMQGKVPLETYARQLIEQAARIEWEGQALPISISVGIVSTASKERSYEDLYNAADQAMYTVKKKRKTKNSESE